MERHLALVTTCLRKIDWAAVWDESSKSHRYARDIDIAFAGGTITYVGPRYPGSPDRVIEGAGRFVMPGLVNVHAHPQVQPIFKGIIEELGNPRFYMSGMYDVKRVFRGTGEASLAAAAVGYGELLLSGVTTVADQSGNYPGWLDQFAASGLRGYAGRTYSSASWYTDNGHELKYRWDETAGRRDFEDAVRLGEAAERHPCGRLSAMLAPDSLDTGSEELLRDSLAEAERRGWPFTVHCAESVIEFNEFTRKTGLTPVQWASSLGLLRPRTILGHCIFVDSHSWLHWHTRNDIRLIAESNACVAHCPNTFARYGQALEDFGSYRRAGINMALGTDTFPHNMLEEMRLAAIVARLAAEDIAAVSTGDIFHAATVGGADALGRRDIGRIAVGAKADLVVVDATSIGMRPMRDPLRSLIYTAADRAVSTVIIDGEIVVENGRVLTLDLDAAINTLEEAQRRAEATVPERDYAGRGGTDISPLSLKSIEFDA